MSETLRTLIQEIQAEANDARYLNLSGKRYCGGAYTDAEHHETKGCKNVAFVSLGSIGECNMGHKHKQHDGWLCLFHELERRGGQDRLAPLLEIMDGRASIDGEREDDGIRRETRSLFDEQETDQGDEIYEHDDVEPDQANKDGHVQFFNAGTFDSYSAQAAADREKAEYDAQAQLPQYPEMAPGGIVPFVPDANHPGYCSCDWRMLDNPLQGNHHDIRHRNWEEREARKALAENSREAFQRPQDEEYMPKQSIEITSQGPVDVVESELVEQPAEKPEKPKRGRPPKPKAQAVEAETKPKNDIEKQRSKRVRGLDPKPAEKAKRGRPKSA